MTDRIERIQRLFQLEAMITTLGIPDSAWMISNVFIGTKVVPSKRDLRQFSKSGHTRTSKICSLSQSLQYVMLFIKVCSQCYFQFHNDKYASILYICTVQISPPALKAIICLRLKWKIGRSLFQVMTSSPPSHSLLMRRIGKLTGLL